MPILNGNDFLAAGYEPGPIIAELIEAVAELEAKGILDPDYAMKLLKRDFPLAPLHGVESCETLHREPPCPKSETSYAIRSRPYTCSIIPSLSAKRSVSTPKRFNMVR